MYFKGSIVITDPCYLVKHNEKKMPPEYELLRPKEKDYLSFEHERDYPDAIPKEVHELTAVESYMLELIHNKKINKKSFIPIKSKQYEKEFQCLLDAEFEWKKPYMGDWELTGCGENMGILGLTHYMTSTTYYGDWGCTVYNIKTDQKLGEFCADSGMVGVFNLEEVLMYNPDFKKFIEEHPWCVTVIENFNGNVEFEIKETPGGVIDKDGNGHRKGEVWTNKELSVVGKGNIEFRSLQTSC